MNLIPIGRKIREIQDFGIAHHLPKTKETAFPLHPASNGNGEPFLNSWPSESLGPLGDGKAREVRSVWGIVMVPIVPLLGRPLRLGGFEDLASLAEFVQGASESYSLSLRSINSSRKLSLKPK